MALNWMLIGPLQTGRHTEQPRLQERIKKKLVVLVKMFLVGRMSKGTQTILEYRPNPLSCDSLGLY